MAKDRCEECKGKEKLRKVKIGTDAKGSYEIQETLISVELFNKIII